MRNDKLRIGMLGSRFAADFHASGYRRDPRVELAAVAWRDEKRLCAYAEKWNVPRTFTDHRGLLKCKDVDVVARVAASEASATRSSIQNGNSKGRSWSSFLFAALTRPVRPGHPERKTLRYPACSGARKRLSCRAPA